VLQAAYYERATKLADAVRLECGDRVVVQFPKGGMFLWVEFPFVEDTEDLVDLMTTHKVCACPCLITSLRKAAEPVLHALRSLRFLLSAVSS
jgi:DNA-binding transcriptional MocR family regulator